LEKKRKEKVEEIDDIDRERLWGVKALFQQAAFQHL